MTNSVETTNKIPVIAISSSPSHGRNSDTMLDSFISGIKTHENIAVEKIYLDSIEMAYYSFDNRLGALSDETAFNDLVEKIKVAKGLVIATPTYNFSVPARLKNFIDRIRFIALDFENKTKLGQPKGLLGYLRTYFIVSGGTPSWAERILFFTFPAFWLRGVFLYYGAHCLGAYYRGDINAFKDEKLKEKMYKKGQKFAKKIEKEMKNRPLERVFWRPPQIS
jgi:multimeric flavodoxin WrbA